jgi:trigger factor
VKVTTEALERCETLLTVEVEPKKEQDLLEKAAKRIAREVKIPGFRAGKAPYHVVVRRFGLEAVQQEALENSLDKLIQDALAESEITPYAQISLDKINWEPLTVTVKIPTKPEVELGNYRDIRIDFEPVEITDEDVDAELKVMQDRNAAWAPVDRPAQIGDMITMRVVEKDGDKVLNDRDSVEYELEDPAEHEGHDHPDMVTPLLGLSAGEETTFTVTYPKHDHDHDHDDHDDDDDGEEDDDDDDYAGKEITFEIAVSSVKAKETDPLDDSFALAYSDFETLAELKANLKEKLQKRREEEQKQELGNKALEKLLEESTVVWAKAYEDESIDYELQGLKRQMSAYGLTLDSYFAMQNITEEDYKEQIRGRVVTQLRRSLVLSKIAELEKLEVTLYEILSHAKLLADMSGAGDQFWRSVVSSPAQQAAIADQLEEHKALRWLGAVARGEDPNEALPEEAAPEAAASETESPAAVEAAAEN